MDFIEIDALVIGGGVIGLALARALARSGRQVTLLEAEAQLGSHSSSRNSEVIHAGIYYTPGSLKARLCVAGRDSLYEFCRAEGVPHERIGKIIVATSEDEVHVLEQLERQAKANGVHDLVWLDQSRVFALEPKISAVRGLLSPSTGIVDSHAYMTALRREAERCGADIVVSTPVIGGRVVAGAIEMRTGGAEPATLRCQSVVNAAGLGAPDIARAIAGIVVSAVPEARFAKGHYFVLGGRAPFQRLVYPVPAPGGLGVHLTLDLAHHARFGPDVSWQGGVDYSFDESRSEAFYRAIRRYYPSLPDGSLSPGYTGIRPKLSGPNEPNRDFLIQDATAHGVPGLVNLFGIESPGLTASLAIADYVLALLHGASEAPRNGSQ